jgi:hypothetical protein
MLVYYFSLIDFVGFFKNLENTIYFIKNLHTMTATIPAYGGGGGYDFGGNINNNSTYTPISD